MEQLIEKYALANAIKYNGKASAGNIIGQIIKENPEAKKDMKALQQLAATIVEKVNRLSIDEQRAALEALAPELLDKKEHKEHDLFAFLGIKPGEKVVTGFPPEPSKYPHIGHAKALLVNYELAKRHNGKFILRFDDTNPQLAKEEFYKIHLENYKWLGVKWDQLDYASDHMPQLYEQAEKLIAAGKAYVCDCDPDFVNNQRYKGLACPHREQPAAEAMQRWKQLKEGEVLRLKISPNHQNTAMRDPTVFRVISEPHPRTGTKYHVWPMYDFQTCVMDSLQGITHRLRTKEFELRAALQNWIQDNIGFPATHYEEFARFNLEGVESSGRIIRDKVLSGELLGWDDPSLTTLVALRRRGFTPEAITKFVLDTGITKNEARLTWDDLYAQNRRILNDTAKRLFFVDAPMQIIVVGAPKKTVHLSYFPQNKSNDRVFDTNEEFYISEDDFSAIMPGKLYRLMDCCNFIEPVEDSFAYHSEDIETFRQQGERILHFLPVSHESVKVSVLMPDKSVRTGLGEARVKHLKIGEVIQFERFGFCRLDAVKDEVYSFWYTHK